MPRFVLQLLIVPCFVFLPVLARAAAPSSNDDSKAHANEAWEVVLEPRQPELPAAVGPAEYAHNPIDRFVAAYLVERGIEPPKPVSDLTYLRRVYLDVIGLLPTVEQTETFLADTRPDKRERLVDELLNDRDNYAQHWLTFWNDALRNDYKGIGYIDGGRKSITTWLYKALADNMPYDQFVRELIDPTEESSGFVKGIVWRGVVNASQVPEIQAAQNISQVFLGINLKCASCHDSFINSWTLADAYGLAGVFAEEQLEMHHCDQPIGEFAEVKFLYPELGDIDAKAPREERQKQLAQIITRPENGRLTRTMVNRLWAKFLGRGLVEPVDEMDDRPWHPDLLDWLASDLTNNGYDLKKTMRLILTSQTYQMPAVGGTNDASDDYVFKGPLVRRMSAEQFVDAAGRLTRSGYEEMEAKDITFASSPDANQPVRAALVSADRLMIGLGRPARAQVVTSRPSLATTLEALELTNGETLANWLKKGGAAWIEEHSVDGASPSGEKITRQLYQSALGREPTAEELEIAKEIVGDTATAEGMEDLLWSVLMLPEFQLIY